jgi:hypothetical protein
VDLEFGADLLGDLLLPAVAGRALELLEQLFDFAVIGFQQSDRIGKLLLRHDLISCQGQSSPWFFQASNPPPVPACGSQ